MIKRRIQFQISINSYFPEPRYKGELSLPVGGKHMYKEIEFETDMLKNSMEDAEKALKEEMGDTPYHIWYWTWLDLDEVNRG